MTEDIRLADIWADDSFNCRGYFSPQSVAELADDIDKEGLLQPITIQKCENLERNTHFKVVMGHRRFAAQQLRRRRDPSITTIRANILDEGVPEHDARFMNIKENLQRVDLNMLQEAHSIKWFKEHGWSEESVARRLGKPNKWVQVRFGLLAMPEEIQKRAEAGYLSQYEVDHVLTLPSEEEQYAYVRAIVDHKEKKVRSSGTEEQKKRTKRTIDVFAKGTPRSPLEMACVQESIQDSFKDNSHPAAVALAWAAGVISYEDLVRRIEDWAQVAGVEYFEHPEITKRS